MNPIDIVITYLNSNDKKWQQDYNMYMDKEIKSGIHNKNDRQSFGIERIREWDNLRYWFRGIEKNCPWINKIFFVVQNERHIPNWLDKNNPKLRIVYHEEFIPKELLPTFNAITIAFYLSNIKDLSENFITCDDDMFFINETTSDLFFDNNGNAVLDIRKEPYKLNYWNDWERILNNNKEFIHNFMNKDNECCFKYSHLPDPMNKKITQDLINKYYDKFFNSFKLSKFRKTDNYQRFLLVDFPKIGKKENNVQRMNVSKYVHYTSEIDLRKYNRYKIVCINDTEAMDDFTTCKNNLLVFLQNLLPNKSSFELDNFTYEGNYIIKVKNENKKVETNKPKKLLNKQKVKSNTAFTGLPDEWWKENY